MSFKYRGEVVTFPMFAGVILTAIIKYLIATLVIWLLQSLSILSCHYTYWQIFVTIYIIHTIVTLVTPEKN